MMQMTFRDVLFWYKLYERQIVEQSIIDDCNLNKKPIPCGVAMDRQIDNKIKKWQEVIE